MSTTNTLATQEASLSEKLSYRLFTLGVVESYRSGPCDEHYVRVFG